MLRRSMRDLRIQYVLTFGMLGAVLPYVSVFFRAGGVERGSGGVRVGDLERGADAQPGAADDARRRAHRPAAAARRWRRSRRARAAVPGAGARRGAVLGIWTAYCLVSMPILPLQDGIHFSQQRRRRERGGRLTSYPQVRVWGTIGYIIPSLLLFAFLQRGMSLRVVLMTGAAFAALAAMQALLLHDPRRALRGRQPG